ncbi:MAG: 2-succinyl-5-enolpyruvyl-6-hydroxy-3-cyclohexene-1-carboxylate synthase [Lachnospiraceae bacterium]|nr:2-succinyl-5-enolpyruvyl-6-hydroxy-3-cyclohexene-1-carboxylate synthase [Lachnospiraceae bacterium]
MTGRYTTERNVLLLIALLKKHNVRNIIVSPGTTNITFVESVCSDSFFRLISSPEERSAAYMACGLAAETGQPVALSCTGATASRNYIPALTEAYYNKLPVLAITSSQHYGRIGNNHAQVIDRSKQLNDICEYSIRIAQINSEEDEWDCNLKINTALMKLRANGGGPVHIDLQTNYTNDFSHKKLPDVRCIKHVTYGDEIPKIRTNAVAIFVGAHLRWDSDLTRNVEEFCEKYNGAVICDHTSNYTGKYGVLLNLLTNQEKYILKLRNVDLVIDIGEVSGAYIGLKAKQVWRVSPDGRSKDRFHSLQYVFQMDEHVFFELYCKKKEEVGPTQYYKEIKRELNRTQQMIPEIPFSNPWIASQMAGRIPKGSRVHLGILNSLRSWNYYETDPSIRFYSNTGGFGIDGCVSALIGASLSDPKCLFFGIIGDLAFFYDMNSLGNENVGKNLRILLVNNGCGTEFRNYNHLAMGLESEVDAGKYIAAIGHYGKQSRQLVKHYVSDLGFEYLCAEDKNQFLSTIDKFVSKESDRPIVLEVFTDPKDESEALYRLNHILALPPTSGDKAKKVIKKVLGDETVRHIKRVIKRDDKRNV